MNKKRLQRLQKEIIAHGMDGLALVPGPNMLYISRIHCHLSERPIVLFIPDDYDPALIIQGCAYRLSAPMARATSAIVSNWAR